MTREPHAIARQRGKNSKVAVIRQFIEMVSEETKADGTRSKGPIGVQFVRALAKLGPEAVEAWLQGEKAAIGRERTVSLLAFANHMAIDRNREAITMLADSFARDLRWVRNPDWRADLLAFKALVRRFNGKPIGSVLEHKLSETKAWDEPPLGQWLLEINEAAHLESDARSKPSRANLSRKDPQPPVEEGCNKATPQKKRTASRLPGMARQRDVSRKVAVIRRCYEVVIEETKAMVTKPIGLEFLFAFRFHRALANLGPEAVEAWLQGELDACGRRDRTVLLLSLAANLSFDRNAEAFLMLADSFRFDARQVRHPYWSKELLFFQALIRLLKSQPIGPALEKKLKDAEPWHMVPLGEWLLELTDPAKLERLKRGARPSDGKPSQTVEGDPANSRLRKAP